MPGRDFLLALSTLLAAAGAGSLPARAAVDPAKRSLIEARCHEEISKLCSDVRPGGGRLARCLRAHESELSNECKAALAAAWAGGRRH